MPLSKRRLSPYFLFALLLILAWVSLRVVGVFLDYVLIGLLTAYLSHPLYDKILAKVRYRPVAALTMVVLLAGLILVPLAFLLAGLVNDLQAAARQVTGPGLRLAIESGLHALLGGVVEPAVIDGLLASILPSLSSFVSGLASDLVLLLAEGLLGVFILLYVLYYAYTDGHAFRDFVKELLPMQEAHRDLLLHEIDNVTRAVMFGQVATAAIQATLAAIGFALFGVPNLILWTFLTFVLALLPVIGPPLVWVPWSLYLMASGNTFEGIGLAIYSAILVSGLDNLIRPKLIGSRAHVHPVIVLLGIVGGIVVFGFSGFILGPLVLSIFVTILDVYRKEFALKMDDDGPRQLVGGRG